MNRSTFIKSLFAGAFIVPAIVTGATDPYVREKEFYDINRATGGSKLVATHIHVYEEKIQLPSDNGWDQYVATGEKQFTFKGINKRHLDSLVSDLLNRSEKVFCIEFKGKMLIVSGIIDLVELQPDNTVEFGLNYYGGKEIQYI